MISKQITFKHWTPFTYCISQINNTQVDNKECLDIVILMHNLIECSDNFIKTSGSVLQYCKDIPNSNMEKSELFKLIAVITGRTPCADNTKDVKIAMLLKYLSNFSSLLK